MYVEGLYLKTEELNEDQVRLKKEANDDVTGELEATRERDRIRAQVDELRKRRATIDEKLKEY